MSHLTAIVRSAIDDGYELPDPCTHAELAAVHETFLGLFGIPIPKEYEALLRKANGLDYNGLAIFAAGDHTEETEEAGDVDYLGLAESNQRLIHGEVTIPTTLRFVGQLNDQLLAYDTADGRWKLVDSTSWQPDSDDDVFETFDGLMGRVGDVVM